MFFILSKIFWLMAQPISMIFLLLVVALVALWLGRRRLAGTLLVLAMLIHGVVTYTSFGAVLLQPLENRFAVPANPPTQVGAIVILGGSTMGRVSAARQVAELNDAGDRLTTGLFLARKYPTAKIVLSGGSGLLMGDLESEAEIVARFMVQQGIAGDRLVLEDQSRNTAENALFTRETIGTVEGDIILVTSAFHMPRSVGLFHKNGMDVVPWPTDYRTPGNMGFEIDIANLTLNLDITTIAIREWIGLAAYHWTGRTDNFLPSPDNP
jgi:uncharacterized SAM-binding protein YcdF (DUF218 family)